MPKSKTCLPDVNVWVALATARHAHNVAAAQWLDGMGEEQVAFCRVTQMGLLRLLTNSRVMGAEVMSQARAWKTYDKIREDSRIHFLTEPAGLEEVWRKLARSAESGLHNWTDAYLVAFAQVRECALVSFDQGLKRFGDSGIHILK